MIRCDIGLLTQHHQLLQFRPRPSPGPSPGTEHRLYSSAKRVSCTVCEAEYDFGLQWAEGVCTRKREAGRATQPPPLARGISGTPDQGSSIHHITEQAAYMQVTRL